MKKYLFGAVAASLLLFAGTAGAADLTDAAVLTLAASPAATYNTGVYTTNGAGVVCTYNMTAHTSSPSSVMSIQYYDPGTNTFFTVLSTAAITADATPNVAMVYPVTVPSPLPGSGVMVFIGVKMTPQFRVQVVQGGSGTATAKVGCINLK